MLTPMNHREIEYNIKKFWDAHKISGHHVMDLFANWENEIEKNAAKSLMSWLEQMENEVFQEDLLLDYGSDCLRLYLMFEKTPKPNDRWLDTWEECNLEGCYKFLGRFRRMILVADYANKMGKYQNLNANKLQNKIFEMQKEVMRHISKGNTMPDRHNAISTIMEGMKQFQKELKIGVQVTSLHSHEIEMAVPHAEKVQMAEEKNSQVTQSAECALSYEKNTVLDEVLSACVLLMAPFAPGLADYLWQKLGNDDSVLQHSWRISDVEQDVILLPIQVNAKTKKVITIQADATKEMVEERVKQELSHVLAGKKYKVIYIPQKIMNIVLI